MAGFLTGIGCIVAALFLAGLIGFAAFGLGLQDKVWNGTSAFTAGYLSCLLIGQYVYGLRPEGREA